MQIDHSLVDDGNANEDALSLAKEKNLSMGRLDPAGIIPRKTTMKRKITWRFQNLSTRSRKYNLDLVVASNSLMRWTRGLNENFFVSTSNSGRKSFGKKKRMNFYQKWQKSVQLTYRWRNDLADSILFGFRSNSSNIFKRSLSKFFRRWVIDGSRRRRIELEIVQQFLIEWIFEMNAAVALRLHFVYKSWMQACACVCVCVFGMKTIRQTWKSQCDQSDAQSSLCRVPKKACK